MDTFCKEYYQMVRCQDYDQRCLKTSEANKNIVGFLDEQHL